MIILIIILSILGALILFYISCFFANKIVSKKIYGHRGDGSLSIKYSLPSDYKNLKVTKDYFLNNKKAHLTMYHYEPKNQKVIGHVLFIHGIGGGHFYSLQLIDYLCSRGLSVYAYDQYASGTSEGKCIESMNQGAIDVKYAVRYMKSHVEGDFYVAGHSWGGYAASQALRYSNRITKCLNIAGLNSEADMTSGPLRKVVSVIVRFCGFTKYGKYAYYTTYGAFKKTSAKVLYLQGEEDLVVDPNQTGYFYQKKFKNKENIEVVMLPKKGHSPIVTYESQLAQSEVMKQFGMLGENLVPLETYVDFVKNNVPDMEVYKLIGDFLCK